MIQTTVLRPKSHVLVAARSTPNIALIKYWGNRDDELRLPAADSLSMTLSAPDVEVSIEESDQITVTSVDRNGVATQLPKKDLSRFKKHHALTNQYISTVFPDCRLPTVAITIDSKIPRSIGLASSAAVFSALAETYAAVVGARCLAPLPCDQVSVIARLGSGSAARSVYGGFVVLKNDERNTKNEKPVNEIETAYAEQIVNESHWNLHDIIVVPTHEEKKVGSTEGHARAQTSPHFQERIAAIPRRMQECIDAILAKDFEKLQRRAEEDCMDMHAVMQSQNPPLQYLSDETYRIIDEITHLRSSEHLEVLYTMDAGPTVHLLCTTEALPAILGFAKAQKGCRVIEAGVGRGSELIIEN